MGNSSGILSNIGNEMFELQNSSAFGKSFFLYPRFKYAGIKCIGTL